MIHFLAQATTQQVAEIVREAVKQMHETPPGGFQNWTPEQWILVIGAGLVPLIVAWRGSNRAIAADTKATEAKTDAREANVKADATQKSADRLSEGLHAANASIIDVAKSVLPPDSLQQRVDLLNAANDARRTGQP